MTADIRCAQPLGSPGKGFAVQTYNYRPSEYGRPVRIIDVMESAGNQLHIEMEGSDRIKSAHLTCKSPAAFNPHDTEGKFFVSVSEISEMQGRVYDTQQACGAEVKDTTHPWTAFSNEVKQYTRIFGTSRETQETAMTYTGDHFGPLAPLCGIKADDVKQRTQSPTR